MNPVPLQIRVIVVLIAFFGMYFGVRSSKFQDIDTRNVVLLIQRSLRILSIILGISLMSAYSMNWGWTDPGAFVYAGLAFGAALDGLIRERRRICRSVQSLQNE